MRTSTSRLEDDRYQKSPDWHSKNFQLENSTPKNFQLENPTSKNFQLENPNQRNFQLESATPRNLQVENPTPKSFQLENSTPRSFQLENSPSHGKRLSSSSSDSANSKKSKTEIPSLTNSGIFNLNDTSDMDTDTFQLENDLPPCSPISPPSSPKKIIWAGKLFKGENQFVCNITGTLIGGNFHDVV
eukprot:TRINITY_DN4724_c1_g2_i4.p1 TRINITY_DN4724_c1_g2~~TRINITY_DN4724_c1_g2_i4.p1  ORF type:complete len:187 (+),score=100.24 TRINITY_DN4724_c1_g2_i4:93-653(+)